MKIWTKVLILTICFSLSGIVTTYAFEKSDSVFEEKLVYPDISDHWAKEAIEALYDTGALNFPKDEPFGTEKPINRAHFLFMLINTKGISPAIKQKQSHFADVPSDSWYFPYVETAYQLGIINGDEKNFSPEASITKQEAILMLLRTLGEGEKVNQLSLNHANLDLYKDSHLIADWAKSSFSYAIQKGYINGVSTQDGNYLYPTQDITRAEAAVLIYQTLYQRLLLDSIQKEDVNGVTILYFSKLELNVTAYTKSEKSIGDKTLLGSSVHVGLVAVDPEVIPYGTHLYIPGYGFAIAADKARKGEITLYMNSLDEVKQYGVKKNLSIYILDPIETKQK